MRSVPASTAAMRSASTRPENETGGGLGHRELLVGQFEVHQAPFPAGVADGVPAGTNTGSDSSSS